jgi:hypothetical protein
VELHRGTIGVSDAPGGGAIFTVELPLVALPDATVSTTIGSHTDTEDLALPVLENCVVLLRRLV